MKLLPFGDVLAEPLRNGVYKPKELHGSGVPVINMKELFAYERVGDQASDRVNLEPSELARAGLETGDLLFARRSFVLEGAGKCSIVASLPEPTTFESSMIRARLDRTQALPAFFFYFFKSPHGRAAMASIATRTAVSGVTGKSLAMLPVPVPPLSTQRKVVSVLAPYDELIANNRCRIERLKEMAQRIYREWFVDFRYPGHETVPLVESEVGRTPQDWSVRPFSALAAYVNGYAFKPSDWGIAGHPIVKIRELKGGVTSETPRYAGALAEKYRVEDGDLLFSWSADLDAYLWNGGTAWLNQHLFRVHPAEGVSRAFLFHALRDRMPEFRARAQGTTMRHIKRSALSQVLTVVPPEPLMTRFGDAVTPVDALVLCLTQAIQTLREGRDLLLPRLISGEIDVEDLDISVEEAAA